MARNVVLAAGFPSTIPGATVDRQCGSSQAAVHFAANLIQSGVVDCAVGGGVESMSRHPLGSSVAQGGFPFTKSMTDQYALTGQGQAADAIARTWNISREQIDEFGYQSHMKATRAREDGIFDKEVVAVDFEKEGVKGTLTRDEGPRPIFQLRDFVTGVEAEANRRIGVLCLLYTKRQTNPDHPGVSLLDLEKDMGFPREYLSFTMWYLRAKELVMISDNSDYALTAVGADYVEEKATRSEIAARLLNPGSIFYQSGSSKDRRSR